MGWFLVGLNVGIWLCVGLENLARPWLDKHYPEARRCPHCHRHPNEGPLMTPERPDSAPRAPLGAAEGRNGPRDPRSTHGHTGPKPTGDADMSINPIDHDEINRLRGRLATIAELVDEYTRQVRAASKLAHELDDERHRIGLRIHELLELPTPTLNPFQMIPPGDVVKVEENP